MGAAHVSAPPVLKRISTDGAGEGQSRPEPALAAAFPSIDMRSLGIRGCGEKPAELMRIAEYFEAKIDAARKRMRDARTKEERDEASTEYNALCARRYFHLNGELSPLSRGELDWYAEDYCPRYLGEGPIKKDYVTDPDYRAWRRQAQESVQQTFGDDLSNLTYPATVVHRFYEVWEGLGRPLDAADPRAVLGTLLNDPCIGPLEPLPSEDEMRSWIAKRIEEDTLTILDVL